MTEEGREANESTPRRIEPYLGAFLLGLAVGNAAAFPLVSFVFFTGPLGDLREAAAPVSLTLGPEWGRGLWALLAFKTLLGSTPPVRGLQAGACAAGLAWFALPFVMTGPAARVVIISVALQGLFGALWTAGSWPAAHRRDRVGASVIGGLAVLMSVGMHALSTRIRLGY